MANDANTTEVAHWNSAKFNHTVAHRAWSIVDLEEDCPARQQVALTLEDARTKLFTAPVPDIAALIEKLQIWWGEALWDNNYESDCNRRVIGDLRRIQLELAGADDREASGRSPKQAAADLAAWQAALAELLEQERLLMEGRSLRWEDREAGDIVDAIFSATDELLPLPAPNLAGVIKKLELIWEADRFETIEEGSIYVHVMRDLNGLVSAQKARASTLQ